MQNEHNQQSRGDGGGDYGAFTSQKTSNKWQQFCLPTNIVWSNNYAYIYIYLLKRNIILFMSRVFLLLSSKYYTGN